MRSLSLRLDIGLTTNNLSATSKRPRGNVEETESSSMYIVVVEPAVTPHYDAQSHAQSRIHQNVFVVNKDTTILQLLQHCVERKVLNSVNFHSGSPGGRVSPENSHFYESNNLIV